MNDSDVQKSGSRGSNRRRLCDGSEVYRGAEGRILMYNRARGSRVVTARRLRSQRAAPHPAWRRLPSPREIVKVEFHRLNPPFEVADLAELGVEILGTMRTHSEVTLANLADLTLSALASSSMRFCFSKTSTTPLSTVSTRASVRPLTASIADRRESSGNREGGEMGDGESTGGGSERTTVALGAGRGAFGGRASRAGWTRREPGTHRLPPSVGVCFAACSSSNALNIVAAPLQCAHPLARASPGGARGVMSARDARAAFFRWS